jgi:site-specific DNA-methyltransferase (cytosine-N4-specific)
VFRSKNSDDGASLYESKLQAKQYVTCADSRYLSRIVPKESVQTIITSPPYWGLRSYGDPQEIGAEESLDLYLDNISQVFQQCNNALRNDGTLWIIIGDCYTSGNRKYRHPDKKHSVRAMGSRPRNPEGLKNKDLIGLPWRVAFRLQSDGWFLRSNVIWHKTNPMPESVHDRPHQGHEHIFLFSKSEKYYFDKSGLANVANSFNARRTVWSSSVNSGIAGHAAPFPPDLVRPCILSSSMPGDVVFDPFVGSGSVGVACVQLDRNFFGIDLIDSNVELARSRMDREI